MDVPAKLVELLDIIQEKAGEVGYYPSDGFVHVDVGPVRYW